MKAPTGWAMAAVLLLVPGWSTADDRPAARTEGGMVGGLAQGGVNQFRGIPFAAPPVGPLRWKPPRPAASWSGTRDATAFGPICPQPVRAQRPGMGADAVRSEDCLTLNVWAPEGPGKRPVMVWIHGGAHLQGAGSLPFYDGSNYARDGIVFVTINYRLGRLGYFAHPALTRAAAPGELLANYGLMDQIAALKWVRRNIAAFGGDPENVTIFGESAGGQSVLALMASPAARGLFAKAISESGLGWNPQPTLAEKEAEGVATAAAAGLSGHGVTAEQLRAAPAEALVNAPVSLGIGEVVDGRLLPEHVARMFAGGRAADVPLIIGSNSFEASLMGAMPPATAAAQTTLPPAQRAVFEAPGLTERQVAETIFTDAVMGGPARWYAGLAAPGAPAFLYHFSYVPLASRATARGAPHAGEVAYVFGPRLAGASEEDLALSRLMRSCWASFAKTGRPACDDQAWPAYSPAGDQLLEFGVATGVRQGFRKTQYDAVEAAILPKLGIKVR